MNRTARGFPIFEQVTFNKLGEPQLAPNTYPMGVQDEFFDGETFAQAGQKSLDRATKKIGDARSKHLQKSFATDGVSAGGWSSNLFDICDAMEYGYGIYGNPFDWGETLLNFFGPVAVESRRKFSIPIVDWRGVFNSGTSGTVQTLLCTPSMQARRGPVGRITIDYCIDPDRGYRYTVDKNEMNDFQQACFQQPIYNIFGQMIDPMNMAALEEFLLLEGMRRHMIKMSLVGTYNSAGNGWDGVAKKENTGLLNFVTDFAGRHAELATHTELLPKTIALPACPAGGAAACDVQTYWESFGLAIDNRLDEIEYYVSDLGGGASVDYNDAIVVMNWEDAKGVQYGQACTQPCGNVFLNVDVNPSQRRDAQVALYNDFRERLRMGKYGAGVIITPSGRILNIWASPEMSRPDAAGTTLLPRGTMHMFFRGWDGGYNPNQYALRPIAAQWGEYINYLKGSSAVPGQYELMLNGTGVRIRPVAACDNPGILFNIDWGFSNAPWMQTKFTGVCASPIVPAVNSFPAMPTVAAPTRCTPN